MGDPGLEIVGHELRHDTVKVAEQPDMAGQPVLGGPGRFGIEVAGERQTADEHAGLALGRADGQRHAGIIDLTGRPRSMLAPHPRFGAGVVQEVAPELAVAVAVPVLLAVFFPDQHQGHAALAKLGRLPVRHRPLLGQFSPLKQQRLDRLLAHPGDIGVAKPSSFATRQVIAHRRFRHADRLRDLPLRIAQLVGQPQKFFHSSHV
jgi:hypothetical protein